MLVCVPCQNMTRTSMLVYACLFMSCASVLVYALPKHDPYQYACVCLPFVSCAGMLVYASPVNVLCFPKLRVPC